MRLIAQVGRRRPWLCENAKNRNSARMIFLRLSRFYITAIWTNVCSIAVARRYVITQPRPITDIAPFGRRLGSW